MSVAHVASNYGFYFLLIWLPVYPAARAAGDQR
jgi:hypothetical protein